MKTIRELKALLKKKRKEFDAVSSALDVLQLKKALPALKRKYEGKYFKYNNGYNAEVRWWLYSHCHLMIGEHRALITQFEITPDDCVFKINTANTISIMQTEISKEEYDKAAVLFFESAKQILK